MAFQQQTAENGNAGASSPTKKRKLKSEGPQAKRHTEYNNLQQAYVKMEAAGQIPWDRYPNAPMNPLMRATAGKATKADKKAQMRGDLKPDGTAAKEKRLQRPHAYIGDRAQKGLRQFSVKVCRKVKMK